MLFVIDLCGEITAHYLSFSSIKMGIAGLHRRNDKIKRHISEDTMVLDVLHMLVSAVIVFMEKAIRETVKFEWLNTKSLAEASIEGRCNLQPLPVQEKLGISVKDENVGFDEPAQPFGTQMITHVSQAQT